MRFVVTGGSGFIATHIINSLLEEGHEVLNLDLINTRADTKGYIYEFCDITRPTSIALAIKLEYDYIIHTAGIAHIVPSVADPRPYHDVNVSGTLNMLEIARQMPNLRKFVYAASSSCYGIQEGYPTTEEGKCQAEYPYALTKYMGEQYVMHWGRLYDLPVISLRLFNVYGPGVSAEAYGAVFGIFLSQAANGLPLTIVGDGTQRRDFTHVRDVADAFVLGATSDAEGEIINIGAGCPQEVGKIAKLLGVETVSIPKRPGEPEQTYADRSKAKRLLGWEPKVVFEDAVKELIENEMPKYKGKKRWTQDLVLAANQEWMDRLGWLAKS